MTSADRNQTHHNLLDAFGEEGCPVCRLAAAAVTRYFGVLNYEAAGDPGVRLKLRDSHGFCARHAHQLVEETHVLATATIYAEILPDLITRLRALPFRKPGLGAAVARLNPRADRFRRDDTMPTLVPSDPCPACRVLADTEAMVIATLLDSLPEASFRETFTKSDGLCLPHLRRALAQAPTETAFRTLRDTALAQEERLLAQLQEIIRKHDYRFREELSGEERGAGDRAIRHVSGTT